MGQKRKRGKSTEQWNPINPPDKKKTEKRKKGEKKEEKGVGPTKNSKKGVDKRGKGKKNPL